MDCLLSIQETKWLLHLHQQIEKNPHTDTLLPILIQIVGGNQLFQTNPEESDGIWYHRLANETIVSSHPPDMLAGH